MSVLNPEKLYTTLAGSTFLEGPVIPRRYTLTHSDRTGDLFLTIGREFNRSQIGGWYTRLMRDEVLAEWKTEASESDYSLHLYCHVSGGLVFGAAGWRYRIFKHHMRQVIQALRYGDQPLVKSHPELDQAPIFVHFRARQKNYRKTVKWGLFGDYRLDSVES